MDMRTGYCEQPNIAREDFGGGGDLLKQTEFAALTIEG